MKKIISLFLFFVLCMSGAGTALAQYSPLEKEITVTYNGKNVDFGEAKPENIGGFTMVPMRAVFELAGCAVSFDGETKTVTASKDDVRVTLVVDSKEAKIEQNGTITKKQLDIAPCIMSDRTLVPVRFISESLGFAVNWNPNYKEVVIIDFDRWEKDLKENSFFAELIFAEFSGEKSFGGTAEITVGFETEKEAYECRGIIDTDFNVYLKSELIEEVLTDYVDDNTLKDIKDKYLKMSVPKYFASEFGINLNSGESLWESVKNAISEDEYIYSSTIKDIDDAVSELKNIKLKDSSEFAVGGSTVLPKESDAYELDEIIDILQ